MPSPALARMHRRFLAPLTALAMFAVFASAACCAQPVPQAPAFNPFQPTGIQLDEPAPLEGVTKASSRFGLNCSTTDYLEGHKLLGIRWMRFENAKWPMCSPAAHQYAFDGSVSPWEVDMDQIIGRFHDAGFGVLPMMFQTPAWAAEPPAPGTQPHRDLPPRSADDFREFCYQFAARYGSTKLPANLLKSNDKASGKGYIQYFEIWNEPNLNPKRGPQVPSWGPWRATMPEFWPVFRAGAEGVKAADPTAKVTSPGFAGMTPERIDVLRLHEYPDGKRPIDFCDVINVHFYSGRIPPEIAGKDPNSGDETEVRYEEHIRRLAEWRDKYRPGAPIWLTETGHDTGGPIGISEKMQAARLPRNLMIALQNGIDRIFIYREKGSTPTKHAAAGLIRNDETRKPGWYSIATMTRQLHNADPVSELPTGNENVRIYSWKRDGQTLLTAWTVEGVESFPLELGGATVTDAFGHASRIGHTQGMAVDDYPRYISDIEDTSPLKPLLEAAEQEAAARKQKLARLAAQDVYFFDFGKGLEPTSLHHGRMRVYQQVSASDLYTPQRGYGMTKPGREDGFQHWYGPLIEKHFAVLWRGAAFRFDVKPGTYKIEMLVEASRGPERTLTVASGDQTRTLKLLPKQRESTSLTITSTGEPIVLSADGEFALRWLRAVPIDPEVLSVDHGLFVGNSYCDFYVVPDQVEQMVRHAGGKADFRRETQGGFSLERHWEAGKAQKRLVEELPWDFVVLQNQSRSSLDEREAFDEFGDKYIDFIKQNTDAEIYLYLTWARKKLPEDQATITRAYCELAARHGVKVAPVGVAFERWRKAHPDMPILRDDNASHANELGAYLASCVFYASITGESPVGQTHRIEGYNWLTRGPTLVDLDAKTAKMIQQHAWDVVRSFDLNDYIRGDGS